MPHRFSQGQRAIALLCIPISWPSDAISVECASTKRDGSARREATAVPVRRAARSRSSRNAWVGLPLPRSGRRSPRRGPCRDAGPRGVPATRRVTRTPRGSGLPRRPRSAGPPAARGRPVRTSAWRPLAALAERTEFAMSSVWRSGRCTAREGLPAMTSSGERPPLGARSWPDGGRATREFIVSRRTWAQPRPAARCRRWSAEIADTERRVCFGAQQAFLGDPARAGRRASAPGGTATTSAGSPSATTWPFSSSIARLQNSVTQFMSWVTSTIALAAWTSSRTRALRLRPEDLVAGREDLVEQQDVGVDGRRDRRSRAAPACPTSRS